MMSENQVLIFKEVFNMKTRKSIAAVIAAALTAAAMSVTASATILTDVVYPSDTEADKNEAYYSIGAMGFFMTDSWNWNQGDWIGIDDEGKITVNYSISKVIADPKFDNSGNIGEMGVMVLNLPEDSYPYDIEITDAKLTLDDGTVIDLDSVNAINTAVEDAESGFRIRIRPTDNVDETTGDVLNAATPEVAQFAEHGSFNGGTLSMVIDFTKKGAGAAETPVEDETPVVDETPADDNSTATEDNEQTANDEKPSDTGVAGVALVTLSLAGAGVVATKKRK